MKRKKKMQIRFFVAFRLENNSGDTDAEFCSKRNITKNRIYSLPSFFFFVWFWFSFLVAELLLYIFDFARLFVKMLAVLALLSFGLYTEGDVP